MGQATFYNMAVGMATVTTPLTTYLHIWEYENQCLLTALHDSKQCERVPCHISQLRSLRKPEQQGQQGQIQYNYRF